MKDVLRSAEEILQELWDDAEGEMTFEGIIQAMESYADQWKADEVFLGTIEDPFEYD